MLPCEGLGQILIAYQKLFYSIMIRKIEILMPFFFLSKGHFEYLARAPFLRIITFIENAVKMGSSYSEITLCSESNLLNANSLLKVTLLDFQIFWCSNNKYQQRNKHVHKNFSI